MKRWLMALILGLLVILAYMPLVLASTLTEAEMSTGSEPVSQDGQAEENVQNAEQEQPSFAVSSFILTEESFQSNIEQQAASEQKYANGIKLAKIVSEKLQWDSKAGQATLVAEFEGFADHSIQIISLVFVDELNEEIFWNAKAEIWEDKSRTTFEGEREIILPENQRIFTAENWDTLQPGSYKLKEALATGQLGENIPLIIDQECKIIVPDPGQAPEDDAQQNKDEGSALGEKPVENQLEAAPYSAPALLAVRIQQEVAGNGTQGVLEVEVDNEKAYTAVAEFSLEHSDEKFLMRAFNPEGGKLLQGEFTVPESARNGVYSLSRLTILDGEERERIYSGDPGEMEEPFTNSMLPRIEVNRKNQLETVTVKAYRLSSREFLFGETVRFSIEMSNNVQVAEAEVLLAAQKQDAEKQEVAIDFEVYSPDGEDSADTNTKIEAAVEILPEKWVKGIYTIESIRLRGSDSSERILTGRELGALQNCKLELRKNLEIFVPADENETLLQTAGALPAYYNERSPLEANILYSDSGYTLKQEVLEALQGKSIHLNIHGEQGIYVQVKGSQIKASSEIYLAPRISRLEEHQTAILQIALNRRETANLLAEVHVPSALLPFSETGFSVYGKNPGAGTWDLVSGALLRNPSGAYYFGIASYSDFIILPAGADVTGSAGAGQRPGENSHAKVPAPIVQEDSFWSEVEDSIQKASVGQVLTFDMGDRNYVPPSVFNALQGKSILLQLTWGNESYLFSGFEAAELKGTLGYSLDSLQSYRVETDSAFLKINPFTGVGFEKELNEIAASPAPERVNDLGRARQINPEASAWLSIPGTEINGPVLQHSDNEYYLSRDLWHQPSIWGSYFFDYEALVGKNALHSRVTVIYGHSAGVTADQGYFSQLKKYGDPEFAAENPVFEVRFEETTYQGHVFAAGIVSEQAGYLKPNPSEEEFASLLQELYTIGNCGMQAAEVGKADKIVILSTCTDDTGYRYIIAAKLMEAGR